MTEENSKAFTPNRRLLVLFCALCAAGFFVSVDLAWLHYKVHTDPGYHSFCAVSESFDCETVAQSPYSVFVRLPVALWGAIGYAALLFLAAWGVLRKRSIAVLGALWGGSLIAAASSLILALVSYCIICSICLLCSALYIINILLLLLLAAISFRGGPGAVGPLRQAVQAVLLQPAIVVIPGTVLLAVNWFFPAYWEKESGAAAGLHTGITQGGAHWMGAPKGRVRITAFSDYLCPYCGKAYFYMHQLLAANPETLHVVHRHFPLDNECNPLIKSRFHEGACLMARAAICAGQQDRFWKMSELLYGHKKMPGASADEKLDYAASALNLDKKEFRLCLESRKTAALLDRDIEAAMNLHVEGTPAFILDGTLYAGMIPPGILKQRGLELPEEKNKAAATQ